MHHHQPAADHPTTTPEPVAKPEPPHHAPGDPATVGHPIPTARHWTALVLLCLAQFMLILDITAVTVALPDIGRDLHLSRVSLTWVITAYGLCFGGLMILGGRIADVIGAKRSLLTGLIVFTVASMATGLATSSTWLIGGRIAQGVGAAILSPAALSTVTTTFEGPDRGKALGIWAALAGAGSAVGNVLGGVLTAGPGWRWLFYVNVPTGALLLITLPLLVKARPAAPAGLDVPGALLITSGTASLIYGLVEAGSAGWGSSRSLLPMVGAATAYAVFALVERHAGNPLMDIGMFVRRPVLVAAFLMLVATGLLFADFFLGSIYLQHVRGYGALATGLLFLPVAVGAGLGAQLAGHLIGHAGTRPVVVTALLVATAGSALLTRIGGPETASPWRTLLPGLIVTAIGLGAIFVAAITTALSNVPAHQAGLASGVVNTFHEVGGAIGVAVVSTVAARGIADGSGGGFTHAFTLGAIAAAAAALISVILVPGGKPLAPAGPHGHGHLHGH